MHPRESIDWYPIVKRYTTYRLPLEAMRQLNLPVVNLGPYGKGAHQPGERVLMSYAFGALPQLVYEVIEQLACETRDGSDH